MGILFSAPHCPHNLDTKMPVEDWLQALAEATDAAVPNTEGVHVWYGKYKTDHVPLTMMDVMCGRLISYANVGANEGHYVYLDLRTRKRSGGHGDGIISLLSAKTFQGMAHALRVVEFLTCATQGDKMPDTTPLRDAVKLMADLDDSMTMHEGPDALGRVKGTWDPKAREALRAFHQSHTPIKEE